MEAVSSEAGGVQPRDLTFAAVAPGLRQELVSEYAGAGGITRASKIG